MLTFWSGKSAKSIIYFSFGVGGERVSLLAPLIFGIDNKIPTLMGEFAVSLPLFLILEKKILINFKNYNLTT